MSALDPASDPLRWALAYARHGWWVFPLAPRQKVPAGELAPHGVKDASREPAQLREWWGDRPDHGIGLACGPSGLAVVDIDPRNGGLLSMEALVATHKDVPPCPVAETGGGGWHYVYAAPKGVRLRNGAIAAGVDLKCDGGYIAVAPSVHPSGRAYRWVSSARPSLVACSPLPSWVVGLARREELPAPLPRAVSSGSAAVERCRRYVATMDPAVEYQGGNRQTFDVARRCVGDFGLSDGDAWSVLVEYNARCLPPWSERQLRKILSDAQAKARIANPKL